ncbi:MAG: hypothetical protein CML12_02940 [Puniceicoccaceae bacterium]|nr:hypothetical protein [Puniceicoccaceae bacterium]RCL30518.1 MAG: 30S ribosomal protein S6 [Puniceicoccaceae bacterium]
MNNTVNKAYKTTFILDLRETEDDVAKVTTDISEILSSLGASVSDSQDLGIKEFARAADHKYRQGHYLEIYFSGAHTVPQDLKEKLRLDKRVNRIFVEADA